MKISSSLLLPGWAPNEARRVFDHELQLEKSCPPSRRPHAVCIEQRRSLLTLRLLQIVPLPAHGFAGQSLWSLQFPDSPLTNEDCSQTSLSTPRLTTHLAHLLSVERSRIEQLEGGAENSSEPRIPRARSPDTEHGGRTKMCLVKLRRDSGFWGVG